MHTRCYDDGTFGGLTLTIVTPFLGLIMRLPIVRCILLVIIFMPLLGWCGDALPSWKDGASRRAILDFVEKTTTEGSPDFVPVEDRIAVFDNDGTLLCEQPLYLQFAYALDRIKELAPRHPEWHNKEPFQSVLNGHITKLDSRDLEKPFFECVLATCDNLTHEEATQAASHWLSTARHSLSGRLYSGMVYQPMLELLAYLRSKKFKTFLVSGGGVEFIRVYSSDFYGIPPEQVIGSNPKMRFENSEIILTPEIDFFNNGPGKPMGIFKCIGRRPILAIGNSDGDFEMLQWTTSGAGPRFGAIIHHDDANRETAYDRDSLIGKLDKALDEATKNHWTIVSMKDDWKTIFPISDHQSPSDAKGDNSAD